MESGTRTRQLAPIPTYEEYMNRALQRRDQGLQNGQVGFSSGQLPSNFSTGNNQGSAKFAESAPSKVVLPPLLEPEELRIHAPGTSNGALSGSSSLSLGNNQAVPPMPTHTLAEQYEVEQGVSASSAGVVSQTRGAERAESNPRLMGTLIGQRWSRGGEMWGPNRLLLLILAIIIILATLLSIVYLRRPTSTQNSGMTTISATATASTGSRNVQATRTSGGGGQNADPYPPYSGVLALNDPLLQNSNNWLEGAADGGSCRFTASGYQIYATLTTPPAVCFASTTNFSNFTYEITMKFSMIGLKYSGGGIAFRANVATDSFYFFEVMDSRSYALQSCINHICKPLAGFPSSTQQFPFINSGDGASNKLAVVVTGDTYTFYVNGKLVTAYTDTGVPLNVTGSIGVMATEGYDVANDRQQPTTALFTNAKVWR
jgi:hypothetical protein